MNALTIVRLAVIAFILDLPWLWLVSDWSGKMIRRIQGSAMEFLWWPAPVVYLAIGYLLSRADSARTAAAMGLATYAIYDFTNLATIKRYEWRFAVADTLWGGALFAATWTAANRLGLL